MKRALRLMIRILFEILGQVNDAVITLVPRDVHACPFVTQGYIGDFGGLKAVRVAFELK